MKKDLELWARRAKELLSGVAAELDQFLSEEFDHGCLPMLKHMCICTVLSIL